MDAWQFPLGLLTPEGKKALPPAPGEVMLPEIIKSLLTLPQRSVESAATHHQTGEYDPAPIVEAATTAMTGGLPLGKSAIEVGKGVTLTSGLAQRPPIGGYRAHPISHTVQDNFPSETVGTHFTTNPNAAAQQSVYPPKDLGHFHTPSVQPVVADIKNYMRYPREPSNWKDEFDVAGFMRMGDETGIKLPFPKNILSGLESAAKQTGGLEKNMIPFLKEKGYDAIKYPSYNRGDSRLPHNKYDSFMAFDPGQVKPRFSQEGQELIKSRGIIEPPKGLLWDDATKLWNTLPEDVRASLIWIKNEPWIMAEMPVEQKKYYFDLMTKLRGLK